MWMDLSQVHDGEQDPRNLSDEEDTVFDRTNPFNDSPVVADRTIVKNGGHLNTASIHDVRGIESLDRSLTDGDTRCGILSWRPFCLQKFANKTAFSMLFAIIAMIQSSLWTYHTSNISTLEKRYRLNSITSSVLLFANELAQVLIAILFSHFKFRQHRGKMILTGVTLSSFSCFLLATTHLLMGPGNMTSSLVKRPTEGPYTAAKLVATQETFADQFQTTSLAQISGASSAVENVTLISLTSTSTTVAQEVQKMLNLTDSIESSYSSSATTPIMTTAVTTLTPSPVTKQAEIHYSAGITTDYNSFRSLLNDEMTSVWPICHRDIEHVTIGSQQNASTTTWNACSDRNTPKYEKTLVIVVIFTANFLLGIASMAFFMSGSPFSEDSTLLPNEIPRIFAMTLSIKLTGAFLGYMLAWSCLSQFVTLESIIQIDSRFLGAYWLGWLSLATVLMILAILLAMFPGKFSRDCMRKRSLTHDTGVSMYLITPLVTYFGGAEMKMSNPFPSTLNIVGVLRGFLRNRIYLLLTMSTMTHIFIALGFATFLPKYLETVFRLRSNDAALLTGLSTVPFQVAGLMLSGAFIARYLPSPKEISHWSCIVTALQIVCLMAMSFLGCGSNTMDVSFAQGKNDGTHCSADCHCAVGPPLPLCDPQTGTLFYSPCHAGCEEVVNQTGIFSQCSCVSKTYHNLTLVEGYCQGDDCRNGLLAFLLFVCIAQFLRGSTVVGRMMLSYKSLQADLRDSIIGLTLLFTSIFAVMPSPFAFGSLFESTCRLRDDSNMCPEDNTASGNCWLYNESSLRFTFNLGSSAIFVVAFFLDALLWRHKDIHDLRIYDGELRHLTTHSNTHDNNHFSTVPL